MSSSPPTTLGKYQIIREIARSNDIVYEAYDPAMNRRVALKELAVPPGSSAQQREERLRRFLREAKAAGSLAHPNIVTVYEVGEDSSRNYIAMEFLDGRTLRNEIDTRGFLPQDRAIEIATDMLCGLDFAHSHGVIHRDIKPENIQILENGTVKLTDFGIARLTFEPNLTVDGQVFGTPSYMSPEQVVGRELDLRSDLFSVGVVLYEMLTGTKPFQGDSVVSIAMAISNHVLTCPTQIGFAMWQVVERSLDKSPALRFQTAKEFIEALQNAGSPDVIQSASAASSSATIGIVPGTAYPFNPYAPPVVAPAYAQPPQQGYPPQGYAHQPQYGYQAPYGQQPYQPTGYSPYGNQVPIYYPPPPRMPLFKPGTKRFLGRLFLTVVILGTFVALIFVGIHALTDAINERTLKQRDEAKASVRASAPLPATPEARIRNQEQGVKEMESQSGRQQSAEKLADSYTQEAQKEKANGSYAAASEWLGKAIAADTASAIRYKRLADLYLEQATRIGGSDNEKYRQLMNAAVDNYSLAAERAIVANDRDAYRADAARCMYNMAQYETDRTTKRELLNRGIELAPVGSPIRQDLEAALESL